MSAVHATGRCRFCRCTEDNPCRVPGGDTCAWYLKTRDVCTAPACITAYHAQQARLVAQTSRTKKRTPGQIHALMLEEKRARRRAARAKRREQDKRGAA
jgi:hypothetical protein